jgi:hypothetical protein
MKGRRAEGAQVEMIGLPIIEYLFYVLYKLVSL